MPFIGHTIRFINMYTYNGMSILYSVVSCKLTIQNTHIYLVLSANGMFVYELAKNERTILHDIKTGTGAAALHSA